MPSPSETTPPQAASSRLSFRESGRLSLLTALSRVLGLLREMTKAAFLGTSWLADSFSVAFALPNFMRRLFAEGSTTAAFVPVFSGYLAEGDKEKTEDFVRATFTVLLVLVLAVVALGMALAPYLVLLFKSEHYGEMALLTRLMFPFLAFIAVASFIQGILNSIGVFAPSGAAPILFNLCWIGLPYLLGSRLGNPARAMAVGVVVGGLAEALCQLPALLKAGYRLGFMRPAEAFRHPGTRRVFALIAPTIVGMAAYQLNILVSTVLASGAGTGAIASIQYSQRLQELVLGIFVVSVGTVLLPGLSKSAREEDWAAFSSSLGDCLKAILLITLPVAVFASLEGEDIVVLLFKRREFGAESARLTAEVFLCHMTGLVFIAANRILSSAFYARGDTKTPTWAGLVSIGVNLLASLAFSRSLGAPGLALALSLASAVNTALLVAALLALPLPGLREGLSGAARYGLRLLAFSILAGLALLGLRFFLPSGGFAKFARGETLGAGLSLLFSGIVYASVGIGALALSRDRFAASILRAFKK